MDLLSSIQALPPRVTTSLSCACWNIVLLPFPPLVSPTPIIAVYWLHPSSVAVQLLPTLPTPLSIPEIASKERLVVGMSSLSVVSNQLEAADHLAHGEEAEDLGEQDCAAGELRPRDVPDLVHGRGRGGRGA